MLLCSTSSPNVHVVRTYWSELNRCCCAARQVRLCTSSGLIDSELNRCCCAARHVRLCTSWALKTTVIDYARRNVFINFFPLHLRVEFVFIQVCLFITLLSCFHNVHYIFGNKWLYLQGFLRSSCCTANICDRIHPFPTVCGTHCTVTLASPGRFSALIIVVVQLQNRTQINDVHSPLYPQRWCALFLHHWHEHYNYFVMNSSTTGLTLFMLLTLTCNEELLQHCYLAVAICSQLTQWRVSTYWFECPEIYSLWLECATDYMLDLEKCLI